MFIYLSLFLFIFKNLIKNCHLPGKPGTTLQLLFLIFLKVQYMYMYVAHLHMDVFQSTGRVTV
jgi:hypothetical protein